MSQINADSSKLTSLELFAVAYEDFNMINYKFKNYFVFLSKMACKSRPNFAEPFSMGRSYRFTSFPYAQ